MTENTLTLYHNEVSTCAQKVRLALAEKGVPYKSILLDLMAGEQHSAGYRKLNPNGVVPTLVHGDTVIIESSIINEYLNDTFTSPPLLPQNDSDLTQIKKWVKRQDEEIHPITVTTSFGIAFRNRLLSQTPDERAAFLGRIPSPERRERLEELL